MMTNIEFLDRYELMPCGSHVLCALSGGRDSVYLLHRLLEWAEERGLTVSAAHYNHHLRGEESLRDETFVRALCRRLQVPLYVGGGDVSAYAKENGLSAEAAARQLRYAFLEDTADQVGADVIATAHHADDLAETMLFQLARGAGTKGLSGIPPRRGRIVRPILLTDRQEIDSYLTDHGLEYVEDSTNADDGCTRNVIRHQVMPVLRGINPEFVAHAARTAMLLREDDRLLQEMADAFLLENPAENGISGEKLLGLAPSVSARVIRTVWGDGLGYTHVRQILDLCGRGGLAYAHVPGCVVRYDGGRLWTDSEVCELQPIALEGTSGLAVYGDYEIHWNTLPSVQEIHNSFNTFYLKYENIAGTVSVTGRRSGDRVKLAGSGCTKQVKKLFGERKLTQPQRMATPILRDEQGIVAIVGFGIAQRCIPEIGDNVIYVTCERKRENGG